MYQSVNNHVGITRLLYEGLEQILNINRLDLDEYAIITELYSAL
jgi:hypothetical protein